MVSVDIELALVGLAAMFEPATLLASVAALVVGSRPLRTGFWFYVGGLGLTVLIGVAAAFIVGDAAASGSSSSPKTWVSILTLVAGVAALVYAVVMMRRPVTEEEIAKTHERMAKTDTASVPALVGAGAVLANPGVFMIVALKNVSQLNPSTAQFILDWVLFALVALLPLGLALLMLAVAPRRAEPILAAVRTRVERHSHQIVAIILVGLAGAMLRDAIVALG